MPSNGVSQPITLLPHLRVAIATDTSRASGKLRLQQLAAQAIQVFV